MNGENKGIDFHHPPTSADPDMLFAVLEAQAGSYLPKPDPKALLLRAYRYAAWAHQGEVRDSGEPYINHPLHVALILSHLQLNAETLAAGLLHDVVEDTPATYEDLVSEFGDGVARLVEGVTKLNRVSKWSEQHQNAANILKVVMAMSDEIHVIFVKLADRLHNLRTLRFKKNPASRARTASEALEVYAPIADLLGIAILRKEMEDIAFSYLNPGAYEHIKSSIETRYWKNAAKIAEIKQEVLDLLHAKGIQTEEEGIRTNPRRVYDMFRRLQAEADPRKGVPRRVPPQLRFHVIVADVISCYMAMAAIHAKWTPIASETRDYISAPLPNGYRSLHTTVFVDRQPVKFQIRTSQMHRTAQLGIIAYMQEEGWQETNPGLKETVESLGRFSDEALHTMDNPVQFLNTLKEEELQGEIYVYTPLNEMLKLPVGSTPIDFAYKVHTEVGHQCRGALVDGHWTPLNRPLLTGERVQILLGDYAQPSYDWLNPDLGYTKSPTAEDKIRRWFRRRPEEERIALGCQQLRRVVERLSLDVADFLALARYRGYPSERECFLDVGGCRLAMEDVLPDLLAVYGEPQLPTVANGKADGSIVGVGSLGSSVALCCKPQPGDDIVGYIISPEHIVEVHRSDCPAFLQKMVEDKTRLVGVRWGKVGETYLACIEIHAHDRPFFLHDVWNIMYDQEVNVADVEVRVNRAQDALIRICIDIEDWIQFNRILARIEDLPGTIKVNRVETGLGSRLREETPKDVCQSAGSRNARPTYPVSKPGILRQLVAALAPHLGEGSAHVRW
jgi:RelA/SpoT family (p)ppGpp synthetase